MEELAWIFNSDFEQKLFSNKKINYQSSKMTQEFEYFIHLLDPGRTVFSNKKYSDEYLKFIEDFTGEKLQLTLESKNVKPWCQEYKNRPLLKKFQNKINTMKFLKDSGFNHPEMTFVEDKEQLETGFLYKNPKSFSGVGHLKYPRDEKKILNLINAGEKLIKERVNTRTLDFSTLIENRKVVCQYENCIDNHFQYKGSIIERDFALPRSMQKEYEQWVKKILEYTKEYDGVMSVDSYLYDNGQGEALFPVCEINIRKTMGYIAYHLKQKYFLDYLIMKLLFVKNNFRKEEIEKSSTLKQTFLISPKDNRFLVYCLVGETRNEITQIEKKLLS